MLHVACCLWAANRKSLPASRAYTEEWVDKLYRGFARNLTVPFRFVCFTDRERKFREAVHQIPLAEKEPGYGSMIQPFSLGEPSIIVGLDTVIVGNIDHMAAYCEDARLIALQRDPYKPERSVNPVALVPRGWSHVWSGWKGQNDMEWLRTFDVNFTDELFPGHILSLKFHKVRDYGTQGARIIYYHGQPKPPDVMHLPWMKEHWR